MFYGNTLTWRRQNPVVAHLNTQCSSSQAGLCVLTWKAVRDLPAIRWNEWRIPLVQTTNCMCMSVSIVCYVCMCTKHMGNHASQWVTSGKWYWWEDGGCSLLYKSKLLIFHNYECTFKKKRKSKLKRSYTMKRYVCMKSATLARINISIQQCI